jgi:hypothetical protein
MNWWLGADPVEVSGYGGLSIYGKNGTFRATPPPTTAATARTRPSAASTTT